VIKLCAKITILITKNMTPAIQIKEALHCLETNEANTNDDSCILAPSQLENILDFFVEEEPIRMGISG
jgi:hypothetical protein